MMSEFAIYILMVVGLFCCATKARTYLKSKRPQFFTKPRRLFSHPSGWENIIAVPSVLIWSLLWGLYLLGLPAYMIDHYSANHSPEAQCKQELLDLIEECRHISDPGCAAELKSLAAWGPECENTPDYEDANSIW